jgi:hypothetical protein
MRSRRWPTLPRSLERSTIGAVGLNDRVRNGNGCGPYALTASNSVATQPVSFKLLIAVMFTRWMRTSRMWLLT